MIWDYPTSMGDLQDPKLEVPTIYKAYFSGLCKWITQIYPTSSAPHILRAARILEISSGMAVQCFHL